MNRCLYRMLSIAVSMFGRKVSKVEKETEFYNIFILATEFRLIVDPSGQPMKSPTVNCTPDLTRTPSKNTKRRSITLRAPSTELKAVWQNLLTRQILIVNSTTLNSPLESPDVLFSHTGEINMVVKTITSIKMCSIESTNNQKNKVIIIFWRKI